MYFGTNSGTYGLTEKFDHAHYSRVLDARRAAGLPVKVHANLTEHAMFGRTVVNKETGEQFVIDHIHEAWHDGFYFYANAVSKNQNTRVGLVIGNRNSKSAEVNALLAAFEDTYAILN